MTALELTVHEIDRADPSMVVVKGFWEYRPYDSKKRLTDAESAADYWGLRAMLDGGLVTSHDMTIPWRSNGCAPIRESMTPEGKRIREQVDTLLRFATLPHYDEPQP